jgi:SAM-dependent methyltransferase
MTDIPLSDHTRNYWRYEYDVAQRYMVPLLMRWGIRLRDSSLVDLGCGEGGGVCAMHDAGAQCAGFDIDRGRIDAAAALCENRQIPLAVGNLYEDQLPFQGRTFDIVVLHDVFEHLEHKEKVLTRIRQFMKPQGVLLITFPPYYSAYGAHQQHCVAWFARLPFFHLVPFSVSHLLPRLNGEHLPVVTEIQKLAHLRMGMGKFEGIARDGGLRILHKRAYIISPNHIRIGLRPLPAGFLAKVPLVNEILCSGAVYLLGTE